jgi:hypothetical protein
VAPILIQRVAPRVQAATQEALAQLLLLLNVQAEPSQDLALLRALRVLEAMVAPRHPVLPNMKSRGFRHVAQVT